MKVDLDPAERPQKCLKGSHKCLPTSARAILGFEKANPVGVCSTVKIPNNKVFRKPRPAKKKQMVKTIKNLVHFFVLLKLLQKYKER